MEEQEQQQKEEETPCSARAVKMDDPEKVVELQDAPLPIVSNRSLSRKRKTADQSVGMDSGKKKGGDTIVGVELDTEMDSKVAPPLPHTKVFVEGVSQDAIQRLNNMSIEKKLGLEFVTEFSENLEIYIVDWKSADQKHVIKSANYYMSLGLNIPILNTSYLAWLKSGGDPRTQLKHELRLSEASKAPRSRNRKLLRGFTFVLVDSVTFEGYKFSKEQIINILRASGGTIVTTNWEELKSTGEVGNDNAGRIVILNWKIGGNAKLYNDLYFRFGLETLHVSYFLQCIRRQEIIKLQNKFKLYSKDNINM